MLTISSFSPKIELNRTKNRDFRSAPYSKIKAESSTGGARELKLEIGDSESSTDVAFLVENGCHALVSTFSAAARV